MIRRGRRRSGRGGRRTSSSRRVTSRGDYNTKLIIILLHIKTGARARARAIK